MTENKRFTSQRTEDYNYSDILDNDKWIGICHVDCEDDFVDKLNELAEENKLLLRKNGAMEEEIECLSEENEQLKKENTMLKEHQDINCQNCQYFVSDSASSDCLKREDIGYKGTCIDGMDLHKLAKNCPYY